MTFNCGDVPARVTLKYFSVSRIKYPLGINNDSNLAENNTDYFLYLFTVIWYNIKNDVNNKNKI